MSKVKDLIIETIIEASPDVDKQIIEDCYVIACNNLIFQITNMLRGMGMEVEDAKELTSILRKYTKPEHLSSGDKMRMQMNVDTEQYRKITEGITFLMMASAEKIEEGMRESIKNGPNLN